MDTLLALLLFGLFSVCVLAVLLTGADAYRRLTQRDRLAFDSRTCTQYVAGSGRATAWTASPWRILTGWTPLCWGMGSM